MGLPYHVDISFPNGLPLQLREVVSHLINYTGQYPEEDLYAIIQDLLNQLKMWDEVLLNQEIVVPWTSTLAIPRDFVSQTYTAISQLTINST
jgi:hypothetical protein